MAPALQVINNADTTGDKAFTEMQKSVSWRVTVSTIRRSLAHLSPPLTHADVTTDSKYPAILVEDRDKVPR